MKYFFLPGRLEDLSWAEFNSVCESTLNVDYKASRLKKYFLLETEYDDIPKLFSRLGGCIKCGVFLEKDLDVKELSDKKKVIFGISSYTQKISLRDIKKLSQNFKEEFSKSGIKVRFVLPREGNSLSSAQVLNHNLLNDGFELVLFENEMGKTLAIQDIESFSARDYDKPFVDSKMGVLPVKLARMMVNMAGLVEGQTLWDPFCGSGNVLLEGLDLGYNVLGSDIDAKSLEGTKSNVDWAKNKFGYKNASNIFYLDILNISQSKLDIVKKGNIDGIVCEPYMGEPQRNVIEFGFAQKLVKQHYVLVEALFKALDELDIGKKINVVVVFPSYKTKDGWICIEDDALNFKNTKLKVRDLHWSRINSIIKRLIFVFEYSGK
jgi:tRNA G10  N-methylase Trm11